MSCRICGDPVDPDRVELGYDYCMKDECQARGLQPIEMARVGVNKAADQFVRADEVRPADGRARHRWSYVADDDASAVAAPRRPQLAPTKRRRLGAAERLRQAEVRLDTALASSFERFTRGVITARELNVERNKLIRAFNGLVRSENIRYRSMLRREFPVDE